MPTLFDPLKVGAIELPNRIIMAPLTRCRSDQGRVPNALMAEYYVQRASAGLILSEATSVTPMGVGYPDTPGIWSEQQIEGWKRVTERVHAAGGRMFLQLWHVGRISHPSFLDGRMPVSSSAIAAVGQVSLLRPKVDFPVPRALETDEVKEVVAQYREGAKNAKAAGFDGVELHGANGYLFDQFLHGRVNKRTDEYGGSLENRVRLLLEVADGLIDVWGADRVGVHLAPRGDVHIEGVDDGGPGEDNNRETFLHVAKELGRRKIAFFCAREAAGPDSLGPEMKEVFGGVYIANERFTKESASEWVTSGKADAVAFGVPFIANPDLVERFAADAPLNEPKREFFYLKGSPVSVGYTDYPEMS